jgi:guanylate kinase
VKGKLIIVCAPSGAGKTTLVKHLLITIPHATFSVSATSRAKRANETNGKDYHFLSIEDFKKKIENDEFVEWEEVYTNQFYGTLKQEVENKRNQGLHVIFDVDVEGGLNLKKQFKGDALLVFVMPPSLEELAIRLEKRATESAESYQMRLAKAEFELTYAESADIVIVNDDLTTAKSEIVNQVLAFLA